MSELTTSLSIEYIRQLYKFDKHHHLLLTAMEVSHLCSKQITSTERYWGFLVYAVHFLISSTLTKITRMDCCRFKLKLMDNCKIFSTKVKTVTNL